MRITHCTIDDIEAIMQLYQSARILQLNKKTVVWPSFEASFFKNEIEEKRQWKMLVDSTIACNWSVSLEDKNIWQSKEDGKAVYIHRIVTNPAFRGNRYIDAIVEWAKDYAKSLDKKYIRLDTWGHNAKLIEYYISAGFESLGIFELTNTANLPAHYQKDPLRCFLQMKI